MDNLRYLVREFPFHKKTTIILTTFQYPFSDFVDSFRIDNVLSDYLL